MSAGFQEASFLFSIPVSCWLQLFEQGCSGHADEASRSWLAMGSFCSEVPAGPRAGKEPCFTQPHLTCISAAGTPCKSPRLGKGDEMVKR